eukprot:TRINITY_DN38659_c0_g1_i5.p1 TRINITY_DN38659_c0_g1~~TRINITY_DN38659_c0_g1_i5.p1  ORF type:complete len:398 (-),score=53.92 TRINITY_DN38659_c0_g1_i5:178-1371(-)
MREAWWQLVAFRALLSPQVAGLDVNQPGDPRCWSAGYSFEVCCQSEQLGYERGCWNNFYNYDLCCSTRFVVPAQCARAANTVVSAADDQLSFALDEVLWHCRVRPHEEFESCLGAATPDRSEPSGQVLRVHKSYESYVATQQAKAREGLRDRFVSRVVMEVVARYIVRHFGGLPVQGAPQAARPERLWGLCHGAKTGAEVRFLREALDRQEAEAERRGASRNFPEGTYALGTDISEEAASASGGSVIQLDFHTMDTSWFSSWDFVYSNALDHSYMPGVALTAWRESLRGSEGLLILHTSPGHSTLNTDSADLYGASVGQSCSLLRIMGFEILDVIRLPGPSGHGDEYKRDGFDLSAADLIFAVRGNGTSVAKPEMSPVPEAGMGATLFDSNRATRGP